MSASVKQNYLMIQGKYPDGTTGVEMVAGGFNNFKVGDSYTKYHFTKNDSPWWVMDNNPRRYHKDKIKPWVVIKVFTQEEQELLRQIEKAHGCTAIENLFASNVEKKRAHVYDADQRLALDKLFRSKVTNK